MIAVLGVKRVMILVVLLALNVVLGASVYMYLIPEAQKKERELRSVRGQVSTLRTDVDRMQVEFEQLEGQKGEFEALSAGGFFKGQSRRQAEQVFNKIQRESGVSKAVSSVKSGEIEESAEAKKVEHKILKSPVTVTLQSIDDVDIFKYLFLLERDFPGHVSVEGINLQRNADVTGTVLRAIANDKNPPLVKAEVQLMWRTMIPESLVIDQGAGQ